MEFKKYKLTDIVKTELGEMTIQKYLDIAFDAGADFWDGKREGERNSKCCIFLNGKSLQISKSQFNYLENKKSKVWIIKH